MYCPGRIKLLRIIETMQKFLLFSKGCVVVQSYVNQTNTSQRKAGKKNRLFAEFIKMCFQKKKFYQIIQIFLTSDISNIR